MATFSGGLGANLNIQLKSNGIDKNVIDSIIAKEVRAVMKVGKETMKELRDEIVNDWFGRFNGSSMEECTVYKSTFRQTGDKIIITIESHIDSEQYQNMHRRHADNWHETYGGDLIAGDYILGLQLDEGIIGLPKESTFREDKHWVNPKPHIQEPLQDLIDENLPKKWKNRLQINYNLMKGVE